jgi:16S rRNA processing protein RimM
MKSIDRSHFTEIGYVLKTHGNKGELKLETSVKLKDWAFLEIQGKPVPFKVEAIHPLHNNQVICKLSGIESTTQAEELVGYTLLSAKHKPSRGVNKASDIAGYMLFDDKLGEIGLVEELIEMPYQLLIRTHSGGKEVLIPVVDEFITGMNHRTKTLHLSLPDGLLSV